MDDLLTSNSASSDANTDVEASQLHQLEVYDLGTIEYGKALELQRYYHRKVIDGTQGDVLLVCSHESVYTCGTSTLDEHLYKTPEEFLATGIPVVRVERGGSVTYHGPEQAILYPIINLHNHKTDVGWYMRSLEEIAMRTLKDYGIDGIRIPGKTGVWVNSDTKIAFSGVRISRWCTLHGVSLNVLRCSERFRAINPCGLGGITIAAIEDYCDSPPTVQTVKELMIRHFARLFSYSI